MSLLQSSHVWVELNRVRLNSCLFLSIVVFADGSWDVRALTVGSDIVLSLSIYFKMKIAFVWIRMRYVELFLILGAPSQFLRAPVYNASHARVRACDGLCPAFVLCS